MIRVPEVKNMLERAELLAHVASQYYEEGLTQADIACRIGTSRSTVSRLLDEAREKKIVEITINYPWKSDPDLETALKERFPLRHISVLSGRGRNYAEILRGLGILAARYIEGILFPGAVFGISWGTAVHSTVRALKPEQKLNITVVQTIGAVGSRDPMIDGPDLAHFLASIYGGEYRYLHAPVIVEHSPLREALLKEPRIYETLSLARRADIVLVGIGSLVPEMSSLLRAGFLDRETLAQLREHGAVGDICARHYDTHGRVMDIELNQRIVGIELRDLHAVDQVIGVAGGEAKAEAILGALRGGHIKVLVTDDEAARKVLALGVS
jgi:DNA-binding transcriptional regulator LsrR (DeoR family)